MTNIEIISSITSQIFQNYYYRLDAIITSQRTSEFLVKRIFNEKIDNLRANFREQLFNSIENFKEETTLNKNELAAVDDLFNNLNVQFREQCHKQLKETFNNFLENGKIIEGHFLLGLETILTQKMKAKFKAGDLKKRAQNALSTLT